MRRANIASSLETPIRRTSSFSRCLASNWTCRWKMDRPARITFKVIIEAPLLTADEIDRAANLVVEAGADWVKTGTGWTTGGTTMEHLKIIRGVLSRRASSVGLKAAGGIRDLATLLAMREEYGVGRFGVGKSAKKILDEIGE